MMSRILLIGPKTSTGGISKYVDDILSCDLNYDVIHFNITRPIKSKTRITNEVNYSTIINAGFFHLVKSIIVTIWNLLRFPIVIIKYKPKIVHVSGASFFVFWENAFYIIISKLFRKKIFFHYLGAFDQFYYASNKFQRRLIRVILCKVDYLAVLSEKVKSIMIQFFDESKLSVIPSTISFSDYNKGEKIGTFDSSKFYVLFVGGADPYRKGLKDIIEAAGKIISKNNQINFVLTGGDNVIAAKLEVNRLGLQNNFIFWGWIKPEEKIKLYNSVNILVLPSYNEGLPYVIIEALAAGLPIVASDVGGIPEVVINSENGYIIKPGDQESLAKYILKIKNDPNLYKRIVKNNSLKAKEKYDFHVFITNLTKIYDRLIS
jgi:glycosyltransferase involved in cell wall biosynthesis